MDDGFGAAMSEKCGKSQESACLDPVGGGGGGDVWNEASTLPAVDTDNPQLAWTRTARPHTLGPAPHTTCNDFESLGVHGFGF